MIVIEDWPPAALHIYTYTYIYNQSNRELACLDETWGAVVCVSQHGNETRLLLVELTLTTGQINLLVCFDFFRANMPDKMSEDKANLAKKLAEQRAKGVEGIPTTAKVRYPRAFIHHVNKGSSFLPFILLHFQICSSKSTSLSLMSMRSKTLSLQQTFLVNPYAFVPYPIVNHIIPKQKSLCSSLPLSVARWWWGGGPWDPRKPQTSSNGRSAVEGGSSADARSHLIFYLWTSKQVWRWCLLVMTMTMKM